jgi:hypothetical protein
MKTPLISIYTKWFTVIVIILFGQVNVKASGKTRPDKMMLGRIFKYEKGIDTINISDYSTYSYTKYSLFVKKRNITLLAVPTMWSVAHGEKRRYQGETYEKINFKGFNNYNVEKISELSTVPHHRNTMTTVLRYLTPEIYNVTLFNDNILSPFNSENRSYYKYLVTFLLNGTAKIEFRPRINSTQLISGNALVDYSSGRVISTTMKGEYDMVNFSLDIVMGENGIMSLLPATVKLKCRFSFIGNITEGNFEAYYGLPETFIDKNASRKDIFSSVRPVPLTDDEVQLYKIEDNKKAISDSLKAKKSDVHEIKLKKFMWDIIGDNVVNRIKSNFGKNNEGYLRINPILNPLYMGYDHKRGFTYKFDVRLNYMFTPNRELSTRLRAGYSFKQKQLYYSVPTFFWYNKRKNGYIEFEFGNGNWITNGKVLNQAHVILADSSIQARENMRYFKDKYFKLVNNYDFSDYLGFQVGLMFHNRKAVDEFGYKLAGMPSGYTSAAPLLEFQYRPIGWLGPYIAIDYERGIKGFLGGDIKYERMEFDAQWKLKLKRLECLQMRLGSGFYTLKGEHTYFLDYSNFRENHIPGGWNDDWSGEFELLNSNKYNDSKWYARANLTYENQLLFGARLPLVGHFIEMERIYASILGSQDCKPYIELGYGFTTRLFSMGLFMSNDSGKIKEFGCKFGFELFRHW